MCDAFTAVIGGLSALSAIAGTAGSQMQSNAQYQQAKAMAAANERNAQLAIEEMQSAANKENIQEAQERKSLASEKLENKKKVMQEASNYRASTNSEGAALDNVLNEYSRMYGNNSSTIDQQLKMIELGHEATRQAYLSQTKQRINGFSDIYIQDPAATTGLNIAGGVLGVGSGIFNAWDKYKTRTNDRSNTTGIGNNYNPLDIFSTKPNSTPIK